jgi:hypothetical protein
MELIKASARDVKGSNTTRIIYGSVLITIPTSYGYLCTSSLVDPGSTQRICNGILRPSIIASYIAAVRPSCIHVRENDPCRETATEASVVINTCCSW